MAPPWPSPLLAPVPPSVPSWPSVPGVPGWPMVPSWLGAVPSTPSVPSLPLSPLAPGEPLAPGAPLAPVAAPSCNVRSTKVSEPALTSNRRVFPCPSRTTELPDPSRVTDSPALSVSSCVKSIVPLQAKRNTPPVATVFCNAANVHLARVVVAPA